jgi:hypothetical protein
MQQIKHKFLKLITLWVNKFHVVPSLNQLPKGIPIIDILSIKPFL